MLTDSEILKPCNSTETLQLNTAWPKVHASSGRRLIPSTSLIIIINKAKLNYLADSRNA